jgi:hypothetical protein
MGTSSMAGEYNTERGRKGSGRAPNSTHNVLSSAICGKNRDDEGGGGNKNGD